MKQLVFTMFYLTNNLLALQLFYWRRILNRILKHQTIEKQEVWQYHEKEKVTILQQAMRFLEEGAAEQLELQANRKLLLLSIFIQAYPYNCIFSTVVSSIHVVQVLMFFHRTSNLTVDLNDMQLYRLCNNQFRYVTREVRMYTKYVATATVANPTRKF